MSFDSPSDAVDSTTDTFDSPSLTVLGWDDSRAAELASLSSTRGIELAPARVARVDRGALTVLTGSASTRVRPSGRLFEHESGPSEAVGTPAVGDWVALDGTVAVAVVRAVVASQLPLESILPAPWVVIVCPLTLGTCALMMVTGYQVNNAKL